MSEQYSPPSTPEEILVVDDTPASLRLLTELLAKEGYRIRPASDGALALKSVAAKAPELVLLNVSMPDMDGYEVCRRLKADEKSSRIPVIFISSFGDTQQKVAGFEAGGVDYITKPFETEEVLARVRTHLRLRRVEELQRDSTKSRRSRPNWNWRTPTSRKKSLKPGHSGTSWAKAARYASRQPNRPGRTH